MSARLAFKALGLGGNLVWPQTVALTTITAGDLEDGGLIVRRLRRGRRQRYRLPAGFTFCGFNTGRQPTLVDAVFFSAVGTGDSHADKGCPTSGFHGSGFRNPAHFFHLNYRIYVDGFQIFLNRCL